MSDATRNKKFGIDVSTQAAEGAGIGDVVGGTVGAVLAAIAAVGTNVALPGFGLVVAGLLAAALAGAGAGGITGGIIGALVGAGIPEYRAKVHETGIREGGILLGVEAKSDEDADKLDHLFESLGAQQVMQK